MRNIIIRMKLVMNESNKIKYGFFWSKGSDKHCLKHCQLVKVCLCVDTLVTFFAEVFHTITLLISSKI